MVSLIFEYKEVIPGTNITAEIHEIGEGWWRYILTQENVMENSGVHEMHLPGIPLTHAQVAIIAKEIETAKRLDT